MLFSAGKPGRCRTGPTAPAVVQDGTKGPSAETASSDRAAFAIQFPFSTAHRPELHNTPS